MTIIIGLAWLALTSGLLLGTPMAVWLYCRRIAMLDARRPRPPLRPVRLALLYGAVGHAVFTVVVAVLLAAIITVDAVLPMLGFSAGCWVCLTLPISALSGWLFAQVALEPTPRDDLLTEHAA